MKTITPLLGAVLASVVAHRAQAQIPGVADPRNPDYTLFLAHFDGNTPHLGKDADYALGSTEVTSNGGAISSTARFGAGALDTSGNTSGGSNHNAYATAQNYHLQAATVEFWIKSPWTLGQEWRLFDIWTSGYQGEIAMRKRTDNALQVYMDHANGFNTQWFQTADANLNDGQWHHIAWNYDIAANYSTLFIDGIAQAFGVNNNPPLAEPTVNFTGTLASEFEIGSWQRGYNAAQGQIDEFRISDRSLYGDQDFVPQTTAWVERRWKSDGSGNWSDAANWDGSVPNAPGALANFSNVITGPITVTVDAPQTVGVIRFDNANQYTVAGANAITMDVASGEAAMFVNSGGHTINAPVVPNDDLSVTVLPVASILTIRNLQDGTAAITKLGAGVLELNRVRQNAISIAKGTLRLITNGTDTATSKVTSLTIDGNATPTAQLDVTNNALICDYSGTSPLATIRAQLVTGYAGGSWNGNGINSSIAAGNSSGAVGYAEASDLGVGSFGGQAVDGTAVLIRYTRLGDANLDGTTNIGDFSLLAANFNQAAGWSKGDFNYDGSANIGDFSLLAANFNQLAGDGGLRTAAVPEPLGLVGLAALLQLLTRKRSSNRRA